MRGRPGRSSRMAISDGEHARSDAPTRGRSTPVDGIHRLESRRKGTTVEERVVRGRRWAGRPTTAVERDDRRCRCRAVVVPPSLTGADCGCLGVSPKIMPQSKIGFVVTCMTPRCRSPRSRLTRESIQMAISFTQRVRSGGRGGVHDDKNGDPGLPGVRMYSKWF